MQCHTCGQLNDAGLRFCVACGKSLIDEGDDSVSSSSDSSDLLLPPGTILKSTYETIRLLGEGGAGAVYEARHVDLGHAVAIKVLFGQLARIKQIRQRFVEEGRIQANLRHPNIVRVSDIVDDGNVVAIVMELIEGETLHDYIQRQREPAPVMRSVQIMIKLLTGLAAAHEHKIVHRDIKPGNVMLARSERGIVPKLCDFGIAKVASSQSRTVTGTKMGTLQYMAPEQFQDAARVDRRADIYALGVTFFEMLTRRLPFETDNDYQLMRAHIELKPPSPIGMRPDIPVGLSNVVLKALEKKREDRFQSCQEMIDALIALPGFDSLLGVASYPGVPISDDLVPPPPRAIRRTRAPSGPERPEPAGGSAGQRGSRTPETGHHRSGAVGPSPFERRREPGQAARPPTRQEPPPSPKRRIPWFPLFLAAFAAVLIGVVVVWTLTRGAGAPPAAALAGSERGDGPKAEALGVGAATGGTGSPADPRGEEPVDGEVAAVVWDVDDCESLADEVTDLTRLLALDSERLEQLAGRLAQAEESCRERLVPPGNRDEYLLRYGQTQLDRLRIARFVLLARRAAADREATCRHILVAEQAVQSAIRRLRRTAENPDLHASLRDSIGELGQSMLDEQNVLQTRYLFCWQDDLSDPMAP